MIKCLICGEEKLQITWKHLKAHKLTTKQYRELHPGALLQDESIIRRGENNPFYGKKHTDELKEWQRQHFTGKKCPEAGIKISQRWAEPNGAFRKTMASDSYRKNMSEVTLAHWRSENSSEHREINRKLFAVRRQTYTEKLKAVQASSEYREKMSKSIAKMWSNFSTEEKTRRVAKAFETMSNNGANTLSSKCELAFLLSLREIFTEVRHQAWVIAKLPEQTKKWNVDFYIPSIDTYVQLDGVYWHGLDRPVEVIKESKESKSVRDQAIYKSGLMTKFRTSGLKAKENA
jgi:hypothetical protein